MDEDKERKILLKVVKHPFITTTILAHSLKQNEKATDKLMEKLKKLGYVKYARRGLPKSWNITDAGIEKYGLEHESERKLPPRLSKDAQDQGRGQGNNHRRGNNQGRGNNQTRGNNQRRKDNQIKGNNQNRGNNQRGKQGNQNAKSKAKQSEENGKDQQESPENNVGDDQRGKSSKRERQEKINELFLFFKEHSEHSFTAKEIAPEFHNISVPHLNSLLYELLSYGDVMKIFDQDEQQLVWYLADCHLEAQANAQEE